MRVSLNMLKFVSKYTKMNFKHQFLKFFKQLDPILVPYLPISIQILLVLGGAPEVDSLQSDEAGQRRGEGRGPGRPDVVGAACIA